jgi:hypothetical protein
MGRVFPDVVQRELGVVLRMALVIVLAGLEAYLRPEAVNIQQTTTK